jgi:hypothetical protein
MSESMIGDRGGIGENPWYGMQRNIAECRQIVPNNLTRVKR